MGYDNTLTYNKIVLTSLHVQKGAKFFGTNPDKYTMIADMKVPGCGSMIKCIETASSINAEIAGKPNPFII
jgi:4-nitrophenyl phosphatase